MTAPYCLSLADLKAKYGTDGIEMTISAFIERAPSFEGDEALAKKIGEMMGDLHSVLTFGQEYRSDELTFATTAPATVTNVCSKCGGDGGPDAECDGCGGTGCADARPFKRS